jgi:hypothetical protein
LADWSLVNIVGKAVSSRVVTPQPAEATPGAATARTAAVPAVRAPVRSMLVVRFTYDSLL